MSHIPYEIRAAFYLLIGLVMLTMISAVAALARSCDPCAGVKDDRLSFYLAAGIGPSSEGTFMVPCHWCTACPTIVPMLTFPVGNLAPSGHSEKMIPSVLATVSANSLA